MQAPPQINYGATEPVYEGNKGSATYSTFLDHSGGLLKVMNTQLVRMVHMMIMLKTVERS